MGFKTFSIGSTFFGRDAEKEELQQVVDTNSIERKSSDVDSKSSTSGVTVVPTAENPLSKKSSMSDVQTGPLRSSIPSSWYTSENFFALETRAIFSQVYTHLLTQC